MFLFKVIPWRNNKLTYQDTNASFILESDNWNDYHYYTVYHIHIGAQILGDGKSDYLGGIKILKKGQRENQQNLVPTSFNSLGAEFCSFCSSLDYFEKLNRYLSKDERKELMNALRDITYDKNIITEFEGEEGLEKSFFRNSSLSDDIFKLAPLYIKDEFNLLADIKEDIIIKLNNFQNELVLNFSTANDLNYEDIPDRVNVLIGKNGCGKSTILYNICKLLYASSDQRAKFKTRIGSITPNGIGFTKLICISYSPFDCFEIPGFSYLDKETICKGIEGGEGRFIYCGIRNIAEEVKLNLKKYQEQELNNVDSFFIDRIDKTLLKDINQLGIEFADLFSKVRKDSKQSELLNNCIEILNLDSSLTEFISEMEDLGSMNQEDQIIAFFNKLSTGHKFVMHAIMNLVYYTQPLSLVLFDEPENHLHPPLLAVFMKTIRMLLKEKKSVMIVTTHSPVILQETLHTNVNIIRRSGANISINNPMLQTFGENVGLITSQVFDLTSDVTDYHEVLDSLLKQDYRNFYNYGNSITNLEKCLGGQLSNQTYMYLINKIHSKQQ